MDQERVAELLAKVNEGHREAFEALVAVAYGELRGMARSLMRGHIDGHTLQPTALVNEAYMRLAQGDGRWDNKNHFFGAAARAMRQVLVAHAREKNAEKRAGNARRVTFTDLAVECREPDLDVALLDHAMTALGKVGERFVRVTELRYFGGFSVPEVAEITGRSEASIKRDWMYARAWLHEYMSR